MAEMTLFARKVYRVVAAIPLGRVRTYAWVAARAGSPGACRAVGRALAVNPYPWLIPCHRVVKSGGDIGEYMFGTQAKARLLGLEREVARCLEGGIRGSDGRRRRKAGRRKEIFPTEKKRKMV